MESTKTIEPPPSEEEPASTDDSNETETNELERLEIEIEDTKTILYVREGHVVYSDQTLNSELTKNENNSYTNTSHEYKFTTRTVNTDGNKEGNGMRSISTENEVRIKPFTWKTKDGGKFYPLVYIEPLNQQQVEALIALKDAISAKGMQENPSLEGINLIEEGGKFYDNEEYTKATTKYEQAKLLFHESSKSVENEEPDGYDILAIISNVFILLLLILFGAAYYRFRKTQQNVNGKST